MSIRIRIAAIRPFVPAWPAGLVGFMITLYSKPNCPQCNMTARTLDRQGVAYEVIDVSQNPDAAALVQSWGYRQVPVVQVGDEHWSGFRPDRLASITTTA